MSGTGEPSRRLRMGRDMRPAPYPILLPGREVHAAVLLPARLVVVGALRTFLAVADGLQLVAGNAQLDQEVLGGGGAPVAQGQVVFGRAALVAMALDGDGRIRESRRRWPSARRHPSSARRGHRRGYRSCRSRSRRPHVAGEHLPEGRLGRGGVAAAVAAARHVDRGRGGLGAAGSGGRQGVGGGSRSGTRGGCRWPARRRCRYRWKRWWRR